MTVDMSRLDVSLPVLQQRIAAPTATPSQPAFFQPGRTYTRRVGAHIAEFQVRHLDTNPNDGSLHASGWYRRLPRTKWHPYSQNQSEFNTWTDSTSTALKEAS